MTFFTIDSRVFASNRFSSTLKAFRSAAQGCPPVARVTLGGRSRSLDEPLTTFILFIHSSPGIPICKSQFDNIWKTKCGFLKILAKSEKNRGLAKCRHLAPRDDLLADEQRSRRPNRVELSGSAAEFVRI